jgi:hypothetical protein
MSYHEFIYDVMIGIGTIASILFVAILYDIWRNG